MSAPHSTTVRIQVLQALLRARRPSTLADLIARVPAEPAEIERALAALARAQLVSRRGETTRLSLPGFAVAVAVAAHAKAEQRAAPKPRIVRTDRRVASSAPSARVIPMVVRARRHRAA